MYCDEICKSKAETPWESLVASCHRPVPLLAQPQQKHRAEMIMAALHAAGKFMTRNATLRTVFSTSKLKHTKLMLAALKHVHAKTMKSSLTSSVTLALEKPGEGWISIAVAMHRSVTHLKMSAVAMIALVVAIAVAHHRARCSAMPVMRKTMRVQSARIAHGTANVTKTTVSHPSRRTCRNPRTGTGIAVFVCVAMAPRMYYCVEI